MKLHNLSMLTSRCAPNSKLEKKKILGFRNMQEKLEKKTNFLLVKKIPVCQLKKKYSEFEVGETVS